MHPRLQVALHVIDTGLPVFPCKAPYEHTHVFDARGKCTICATFKRPATAHGLHDRTTDRKQIINWFSPDSRGLVCNIGFVPADAGCTVIDLDGAVGSASWAQLCAELGMDPGTPPMVRTPSGGLHLYYSGMTTRPSAGLLGEGIDVRSEGSYVLLPPSEVGGVAYAWL